MNTAIVVNYLRSKEWSAGNGQCPECWGGPKETWEGHPAFGEWRGVLNPFGHEHGCPLAACLEALGETVERQRD